MKFAHIRVSEYFTFAKQIFHSEAISLARRANFVEKKSKPYDLLFFLEVTAGFEPADNGVADRGLTTWLRHHISFCPNIIAEAGAFVKTFLKLFLKSIFCII